MRALERLKDLFRSEKGNTLVIGAATLPLLIGSAAFAIDTIQFSLMKRQLQRAADSAAIAGAYALAQNETPATAVDRDLGKNEYPTLTSDEQVDVGSRLGFNRTVRVRLNAAPKMALWSYFTGTTSPLTADATAAVVDDGEFCLVSLYEGTEPGIDVNGNADVMLDCGMKTNSRGAEAVTAGGSSNVRASPIAAVGGIDGSRNNFIQPTTLQPYSAKQQDPLAWVPNPTIPSPCSSPLPSGATLGSNTTYCFTSGEVKPSDTTNLGTNNTIIINGGDLDIKGDINGTNVTIILTSPSGQAGDLKINSGAKLNLTAPDNGPYKGVLFYRDRRASNIEIKINGHASSTLKGALYFPSSDITFAGGAGMNVACLQMVGQILKFRGGAELTNECEGGGPSAFRQTIVRLVD